MGSRHLCGSWAYVCSQSKEEMNWNPRTGQPGREMALVMVVGPVEASRSHTWHVFPSSAIIKSDFLNITCPRMVIHFVYIFSFHLLKITKGQLPYSSDVRLGWSLQLI